MSKKQYAVFKSDGSGGPVTQVSSNNFDRKTAMALAASIRKKTGEKAYARAVKLKGGRP